MGLTLSIGLGSFHRRFKDSLKFNAFTPASIDTVAWYDPSDFSTMFQNSLGTTPVTAVEQPVGLLLDKSRKLALGNQIVDNPGFDTDTIWTKGTGWVISGGVASRPTQVGASSLTEPVPLTAGVTYRVRYTVVTITAGNVRARFTGGTAVDGTARSTPGTYTEYLTALSGNTTFAISANTASTDCSIDNVSVQALAGSHAWQATAPSRPILRARYNQILNSGFNGAVAGTPGTFPTSWFTGSALGTTNAVVSDGAGGSILSLSATTNRHYIAQTIAVAVATYKAFLRVNSNTGIAFIQLFVTTGDPAGTTHTYYANGVLVNNSTYIPQAGDVLEIRSVITTAGNITYRVGVGVNANQTGTVAVSQFDVRVAGDGVGLPSYQRVGVATDYDTVGFPPYLDCDGTDDSFATSSIDLSGTNRISVFAGARKRSDAARGILLEFSNVATGRFSIEAPQNAGTGYIGSSGGSIVVFTSGTNHPAPDTSVLSLFADIAADTVSLFRNGTLIASSVLDQGTGNFANGVLQIGQRSNSTLRFNGRIYGLIILGRTATAIEVSRLNRWMNSKTRAY